MGYISSRYPNLTSIPKNVYIDKLDDIVNEYNNISWNNQNEMKFIDVISGTHIDFDVENNDKDSKFNVGDLVRISKHKNIFTKGYTPNWSEEVFVIDIWTPWTYAMQDTNGEDIVGTCYEK